MHAAEIKACYADAVSSSCQLDRTITKPEMMQAGEVQQSTHFTNSHATCYYSS